MMKNANNPLHCWHGDDTCRQTDKTKPANKCSCDTLLKRSAKLSAVLTTGRPGCSAHFIKLQTLRALINVPAKFHKWGINYNWFHSLIHLLKWHSFIPSLTCLALSLSEPLTASDYKYTLLKVLLEDFSLRLTNCYSTFSVYASLL